MTEIDLDTVGPVDVAVILFEDSQFNGDVAPALQRLHETGTVRIIDLALIARDAEDSVSIIEVEDSVVAAALAAIEEDPLDLLSEEDLTEMAMGLEIGSSALVLVWENTWAAEFAAAVRGSNGRLIVQDRIPREVVERAVLALDDAE